MSDYFQKYVEACLERDRYRQALEKIAVQAMATPVQHEKQPWFIAKEALQASTVCSACEGYGLVCEDHVDKAFNTGTHDCGGAGMPCPSCTPDDPERDQTTTKTDLTKLVTEGDQ